ncbi:hypothetical protein L1049_008551 [Liquidambar formosana]|uniref:Uncharacterized protein n=1 Tax=Liquidambar formosana TaxID=63359 RepID=A0AAP0S4F7_LIQFO
MAIALTKIGGSFPINKPSPRQNENTAKATGIEGRIVNLSSIAHLHTYEDGIQFDRINDEKRDFEGFFIFSLEECATGVTGKYYLDCNDMQPSAFARDEGLAQKLWDFSNKYGEPFANGEEGSHLIRMDRGVCTIKKGGK